MMPQSIVRPDNVRPLKPKSRRRGWIILLFAVLVVGALATGSFFLLNPTGEMYTLTSYQTTTVTRTALPQIVEGSGEVAFPTQIVLTSPEAGYTDELFVQEGDSVLKNQVLGSLTVPDLEDAIEDVDLSLINARSTLSRTIQQNQIEIDRKRRALQRLEDTVAEAQEEVDRIASLVEINASRKSELEDAEDRLEDAVDDRDEQALQIEEDMQLNQLSVESQELQIEELELKRRRLVERLQDATVISPLSGTVLNVAEAMSVSGTEVAKGASLFTVADPTSARVELEVSESYASGIQPGQDVALNISGTDYPGTVDSVGAVAELASGSLEATVLVTVIPETDGSSLLQGATAAGEFNIGSVEDALVLPRGAFLSTGSQQYVYVVDGNTAGKTEVTYGTIQATQVQIVSGVAAGDEVITSGYQNYIDQDVVRLKPQAE